MAAVAAVMTSPVHSIAMRSHPGATSISPSPETWASVASPNVAAAYVTPAYVSASNTPASHLPPADPAARPC